MNADSIQSQSRCKCLKSPVPYIVHRCYNSETREKTTHSFSSVLQAKWPRDDQHVGQISIPQRDVINELTHSDWVLYFMTYSFVYRTRVTWAQSLVPWSGTALAYFRRRLPLSPNKYTQAVRRPRTSSDTCPRMPIAPISSCSAAATPVTFSTLCGRTPLSAPRLREARAAWALSPPRAVSVC